MTSCQCYTYSPQFLYCISLEQKVSLGGKGLCRGFLMTFADFNLLRWSHNTTSFQLFRRCRNKSWHGSCMGSHWSSRLKCGNKMCGECRLIQLPVICESRHLNILLLAFLHHCKCIKYFNPIFIQRIIRLEFQNKSSYVYIVQDSLRLFSKNWRQL